MLKIITDKSAYSSRPNWQQTLSATICLLHSLASSGTLWMTTG